MPSRLDSITQQRLEKLEKLRSRGIEPYPPRYRRTHTTQQALAIFEDQAGGGPPVVLSLAGRIVASRSMGKASFLDLRDGYGKLQVYLRRDRLAEDKYSLLGELDIGDIIGVQGTLFRTHSGEITLQATDLVLLAKSLQPLPEKWHGLTDTEKRYRQRYLDLIASEETRQVFWLRSRTISALRRFMEGRGFIEVETPTLQAEAGGALARPFVTHHNALDRDLYLRIATELHLKRLIVGGFDAVYEVGRIFRNEGIDTKHNPEFTTMESYQAYADYNDVMAMVEEMVSSIAREVLGTTKLDYGGQELELAPPWPRVELRQAIKERCGIDIEDYPDAASLRAKMDSLGVVVEGAKARGKLIDELISTYVEPGLIQPTFVIDYPVELSPLAKRKPGSDRYVERFEAFAGGMEVANAFTELNDPLEQRQRLEQQLRDREIEVGEGIIDEDFLTALEYGMPPTGGLGVGIDRLVMLLTDRQSIREVILFPQLKSKE
ncbi:MAG: lysine--tRNA ligase [Chloroflexi bacterium]|nr:lysine--tRNA ligase [Chloroflexota bacterium]